MGLALSRREGDSLWVGDSVRITVVHAQGNVRLHIEAPRDVRVMREELLDDDELERRREVQHG